jgi:hypothetical protein
MHDTQGLGKYSYSYLSNDIFHCPQVREMILLLLHNITNLQPLIDEINEMFLNSATGISLKLALHKKHWMTTRLNLKEIYF